MLVVVNHIQKYSKGAKNTRVSFKCNTPWLKPRDYQPLMFPKCNARIFLIVAFVRNFVKAKHLKHTLL